MRWALLAQNQQGGKTHPHIPCPMLLSSCCSLTIQPFIIRWEWRKWNVSLSSVRHSIKLIKPKEEVTGTPTIATWSEAQMTIWTCNWCLNLGVRSILIRLNPLPAASETISRSICKIIGYPVSSTEYWRIAWWWWKVKHMHTAMIPLQNFLLFSRTFGFYGLTSLSS